MGRGFETRSGWILDSPGLVGKEDETQLILKLDGMAEWSKAAHLSCALFGGEGSNPSAVIQGPVTQLV